MTKLMIVALGLGVIAILLGVVLFQKLRKTKNSLERECHQQTQIGQRLALQYFTSEGLAQAESIPTSLAGEARTAVRKDHRRKLGSTSGSLA